MEDLLPLLEDIGDYLVPLSECKGYLPKIIEALDSVVQTTKHTLRALGSAIETTFALLGIGTFRELVHNRLRKRIS